MISTITNLVVSIGLGFFAAVSEILHPGNRKPIFAKTIEFKNDFGGAGTGVQDGGCTFPSKDCLA